jgi:hypothetical protein
MRKIIIILIFLFNLYINAFADDIEPAEASRTGLIFMTNNVFDEDLTINQVWADTLNDTICFYTVTFSKPGWIMIAADNDFDPVIGYSENGIISPDLKRPPALNYLLGKVKHNINKVKHDKIKYPEARKKWDNIKGRNKTGNLKSAATIGPSNILSNTVDGWIAWGQGKNNSGTCTPSYNSLVESCSGIGMCDITPFDCACECGRYTAGCGAIAMGQIMWYWRWPNNYLHILPSFYVNYYDWDLIPSKLNDGNDQVNIDKGNEVAKLLKDCGTAADMAYWSTGSWTQLDDLVNGLNSMGYTGMTVKDKIFLWPQFPGIVKDEIDAGRPLIFLGGDNGFLPTHYFICDGYGIYDPSTFTFNVHFNFGWYGYYDGIYNIYHINPPGGPFDDSQSIIYNIQPDCNSPLFLYDLNLSATVLTGFKHIQARNNISAESGTSYILESNSKLILTAGNSITFKPGFNAKHGSTLKTHIRACGSNRTVIQIATNTKSGELEGTNNLLSNQLPDSVSSFNSEYLMIYPNPNYGNFTVENCNNCNVKIYDMQGKPVMQVSRKNNKTLVNMSSFASGMYYVKAILPNKMITKKIIKL